MIRGKFALARRARNRFNNWKLSFILSFTCSALALSPSSHTAQDTGYTLYPRTHPTWHHARRRLSLPD